MHILPNASMDYLSHCLIHYGIYSKFSILLIFVALYLVMFYSVLLFYGFLLVAKSNAHKSEWL